MIALHCGYCEEEEEHKETDLLISSMRVLYIVVCVFCLIVSGYTQEEKVEIAHRHLIPNQLEQHGLTPQQLHIPQETTQDIIGRYRHTHTCK